MFRGDISLFEDAVRWTEDYTGIKVVGVVPLIKGVNLPEEDSLIVVRQQKNYGEHETLTESFDIIAKTLSQCLNIDYILRLFRRVDTKPLPQ